MGGYDSHFIGRFTISPPLTWGEIRSVRSPGLQDLRLELDEVVTETATGQTKVVTGIAVVPITRSPYNGIAIEEELQALLDAHPSHEFLGEIAARPEDPSGEPWRYIVRDRRAVRQVPVLGWRDAETGA